MIDDRTVNYDLQLPHVDNALQTDVERLRSALTGADTALKGLQDSKQGNLGFTPENTANKGVAGGYAGLDGNGHVPASQLPSFVDDVLEYASVGSFPATGETGKIYVALDANKNYRWSGTVYVEISASPGSTDAVPEGATNLYHTVARVRAAVLDGLSLATSTAITAADTILSALGKLQAQVSLRLLKAGDTMTGNLAGTDNQLQRWMLTDTGFKWLDKGTVSAGTATFDYTAGSAQRVQVGGNITLAISNWPPTGNLGELLIELVNGGSATVTMPTVNWILPDGTSTTVFADYLAAIGRAGLQASGSDWPFIWTRDAGTTLWGKLL